jgi:hypothetical protein
MKKNQVMRAILASAAIVTAGGGATAFASSHREAPGITLAPKLDGTDFYMFRSYEKGRSNFVTLIANYQPFQDPRGGPNYFAMDPDGVYDIDIDNVGDAQVHLIYRFTFHNRIRGLSVAVGGDKTAIPLINDGPIGVDRPLRNLNVLETYNVTLIKLEGGKVVSSEPLVVSSEPLNDRDGDFQFTKPVDNIGNKSIPHYPAYAKSFIYEVRIPGCQFAGKVFAGQRKDPFYISLGETFDLVNYTHPIGEAYANTAVDTLASDNVTSLAVEVPIACLRTAKNPIVGGWTTSYKTLGTDKLQEMSRLGNPLVNELAIGLPDKDKWNNSQPSGDAQFAQYVTNPSLPALIHELYPSLTAPTQFPRKDLVAVFLTGVAGLNQPAGVKASEEMRLNVQTPAVEADAQKPLGVIGGDNAGYPNGRRPADDVVDISLRVFMGKLYSLGLFGGATYAPSGDVELTDGVRKNARQFDKVFPYLLNPIPGSPQAAFDAAVKADR